MKRRVFLKAAAAIGAAAITVPEPTAYASPKSFDTGAGYDRLGTLDEARLLRCHLRTWDGRIAPVERIERQTNKWKEKFHNVITFHFSVPNGEGTAFMDFFDDRGVPITRIHFDGVARPGEQGYLGCGFKRG